MHRCRSVPGGNDQAPFESNRRPGQSCLRCKQKHRLKLKLKADYGKEYDLRNTQSIEESVRHSDVVYNLVGRNYPTK
jgi:hypothetical protein